MLNIDDILEEFLTEDGENYHDQKSVQLRYATWLRESYVIDLLRMQEFEAAKMWLEDEIYELNNDCEGWMADVAETLYNAVKDYKDDD